MPWRGVRFVDRRRARRARRRRRRTSLPRLDGYTTNLPLAEALKDDVLLVHTVDGEPLPREHGGPVRMITPQLYAWKGAKWIRRLEFLKAGPAGLLGAARLLEHRAPVAQRPLQLKA